ncbi:myb/SANT-like DNA-binding domain-containing protein [Phthorimaea operculella]|nr:myb/SANT-like DNA-binding domain-containing protein [Phthorimaea operculella]
MQNEVRPLWKEIADKLNACDGPKKTVAKWKKTWRDKKYVAKKAELARKRALAESDGDPTNTICPPLSEVDQRVLQIVRGKTAVQKDPRLSPDTSNVSSDYDLQKLGEELNEKLLSDSIGQTKSAFSISAEILDGETVALSLNPTRPKSDASHGSDKADADGGNIHDELNNKLLSNCIERPVSAASSAKDERGKYNLRLRADETKNRKNAHSEEEEPKNIKRKRSESLQVTHKSTKSTSRGESSGAVENQRNAFQISFDQMSLLVDFMSRNKVLLQRSQQICARAQKARLWRILTKKLNACNTGPYKTQLQWRKTWRDKRYHVKKAELAWRKSLATNGENSSNCPLSEIEKRIIEIIRPETTAAASTTAPLHEKLDEKLNEKLLSDSVGQTKMRVLDGERVAFSRPESEASNESEKGDANDIDPFEEVPTLSQELSDIEKADSEYVSVPVNIKGEREHSPLQLSTPASRAIASGQVKRASKAAVSIASSKKLVNADTNTGIINPSELQNQISADQMILLVEFLSRHKDLVLYNSRRLEDRAQKTRVWKILTKKLNGCIGPNKTLLQWRKTWRDKTYLVKKAELAWRKSLATNGENSSNCPLSYIDKRIIEIIRPETAAAAASTTAPLHEKLDEELNEKLLSDSIGQTEAAFSISAEVLDGERVALSLSPSRPESEASNVSEEGDADPFEDVPNCQKRSDIEMADLEVSVPVNIKTEREQSPPQMVNGRSSPNQNSFDDNDDPLYTGQSRTASRASASGQMRRASKAAACDESKPTARATTSGQIGRASKPAAPDQSKPEYRETVSIASSKKLENADKSYNIGRPLQRRKRKVGKKIIQSPFQLRLLEIEQEKINLERQKVTELSGIRLALNQLIEVMGKSSKS